MTDEPVSNPYTLARDIISRHIERTTGIYDTDCADAILAEIGRTHAIVPLEPTAEMCECGPLLEQGAIIDSVPPITTSQADAVYRAMLRASPPQPPTRAGGEDD